MRKVLMLITAALMMFMLVGCGAQNAAEKESEDPQSSEIPVVDPGFDTGWAGDHIVMPVPQPPADFFTVEESDGSLMIRCIDTQEIGKLSLDDVLAYCEELKKVGFNAVNIEREVEEDDGYEFEAVNDKGVTAYLAYSDKKDYILVVVE